MRVPWDLAAQRDREIAGDPGEIADAAPTASAANLARSLRQDATSPVVRTILIAENDDNNRKHVFWVSAMCRLGCQLTMRLEPCRRGEQVARLMHPEVLDTPGLARALASRIRRSRAGHPLNAGVSLRELIDEGRH